MRRPGRPSAPPDRSAAWRLLVLSAAFGLLPLFGAGCGPDWDALESRSGSAEVSPACVGSSCGACDSAVDCPGVGSPCQTRVCIDHVCEVRNAPSGTPAAVQIAGDCSAALCDRTGAVVAFADDQDLPDDSNDCTVDACRGGVAFHAPEPAGAACGEGGGEVCDGIGACVMCNRPLDCGLDTPCQTFSCEAATCSSATLPLGASCGTSALCDSAGACAACVPPSIAWFEVANALAIPDGSPVGVTSTLAVSGLVGALVDVDVHTLVGSHPAAGDLELRLISPAGTEIVLTRRNGGQAANTFAGTTFDDDAVVRITEVAFSTGEVVARVAPERSLALLNGEPANGAWGLRVVDEESNGATGALEGWSLTLITQEGNPTLTPSVFQSDVALSIPSANPSGVTSTLPIAGVVGVLGEVTVTVEIEHPDSVELSVALESPAGKTVALTTRNGDGVSNAFDGTTFDERAPVLMGCAGIGCVTFPGGPVGRAIPEGALSALVGDTPNGDWKLRILDNRAGHSGTLRRWSLALTPALCSQSP